MTSFQVLSCAGEMSFHTQGRSSFMRKRVILQQQHGGFGRRTRQGSQGGRLPPRSFCVILNRAYSSFVWRWGKRDWGKIVSTNWHQFSQIGFVVISVDLWTGRECCQYPVLPVPVPSTNGRISNAYRKLVIGNISLYRWNAVGTLQKVRTDPQARPGFCGDPGEQKFRAFFRLIFEIEIGAW